MSRTTPQNITQHLTTLHLAGQGLGLPAGASALESCAIAVSHPGSQVYAELARSCDGLPEGPAQFSDFDGLLVFCLRDWGSLAGEQMQNPAIVSYTSGVVPESTLAGEGGMGRIKGNFDVQYSPERGLEYTSQSRASALALLSGETSSQSRPRPPPGALVCARD